MPTREFTGKERDAETGYDYFGARYYGAKAARFTTIDPAYTSQENLVDPQRWNRYAYVRNNPLRYVDPDGRRDVNAQDKERFRSLRAEAHDPAFESSVENAISDIKTVIRSVPSGAPDPPNLAVTGFAIDNLGNPDYGRDGTVSNGQTQTVGSGAWKCNIFVANAYAEGAGVGFDGKGVPTTTTITGHRYPPVANTWGDGTATVANFAVTSKPGVGTVAGFPHRGGLGHSAISVGGGVLIYAGENYVKANTIERTQEGVGASSVTHREYKP